MLSKKILQILVLAGTWMMWDRYAKDTFISWVSGGAESPGLSEIFVAYLTPFVLAFVLSALLIKVLAVDQPEGSDGYG